MIRDKSGLFPIGLLIYLVGGVVGMFFFIFFFKQIIWFMVFLVIIFIMYAFVKGRLKAGAKHGTFIVVFVVVIIVVLALLMSSGWLFGMGFMVWQPDFTVDTDTHDSVIGYGQDRKFTGHIELDDTRYITAMYDDYEGQKVTTITSWMKMTQQALVGGACANVDKYWYEVQYNDGSGWVDATDWKHIKIISGPLGKDNWIREPTLWDPSTWNYDPHNLKVLTFATKGSFVGGIKVELHTKIQYYNCALLYWTKVEEGMVSTDGAYLHSGVGRVVVKGVINKDGTMVYDAKTAEEGGKVIIHVECGAGDWEARIYKGRSTTTAKLDSKSFSEGCNEDWEWTVPTGSFIVSSDPLANQHLVYLYNKVINQGIDDFFTVDKRDYIPPVPTCELSDNYAVVGNDVTITMTAEVNEQTNLPIGAFNVWIWYGETKPGVEFSDYWVAQNQVVQEVNKIGNRTYQASYTFNAHKMGTIKGECKAIDTEGRASDPAFFKINAYWDDDDPPLNEKLGDFWFIALIILAIAGTGILAYYIGGKRRR